MSEEARVHHADEAVGSESRGQKYRVKKNEIWEADSNNWDVDRESSVEFDIDESLDLLRPIAILYKQS